MNKILFLSFVAFFLQTATKAQIGGTKVFGFLEFPASAKVSALGGSSIAVTDSGPGMAFQNPAMLMPLAHNRVSVGYTSYFAGISYLNFSYARHYKKAGTFALGIQSVDYGDFTETDNAGNITGNFSAKEWALNLAYSRPIDSLLRFGINVKPAFSKLENYKSSAIALDAGISLNYEPWGIIASLVAKNYGTQFDPYVGTEKEDLPFQIQFGISKKLAHAPFRFSMVAHHLETPDLRYSRLNNSEPTNSSTPLPKTGSNENLFDAAMRHVIIGVEFLPFKNLSAYLGYNHQRRKDLSIEEKKGKAGISWGAALNLKKLCFQYSNAGYHLAGATNQISLVINLNEFTHKKNNDSELNPRKI